ncbi:MAG: efflux RND transporter periplasmic adaptor subunit [Clostridia bacterium]|nr:efflux RND transporter periplasmic adaptor subunit [Clostridia bacterium]
MSEKTKKKRGGKRGRAIRKWIKRIVLLVVAAAAALFGAKAYIRSQADNAEEAESYSRAPVIRGAMEETVYGTGTTSARSQPNLLAEADGTLTELRVDIGDEVKKGDILAVLTNEEIDDTITDLEFALWDLDETIRDTAAGSKVTTIESPAKGRIAAVYAKPGDDTLAVFRREGALAILSTDGRMKIELTAKDKVLGLALDERVTVSGQNIHAEGTVVDLTRQGTSAVITVYEDDLPVEMDFDKDGLWDQVMGAEVTVTNAAGEVVGTGELEPNKPIAVSAFGGTIRSSRAKIGDEVNRGETLFGLDDAPLTLAIEDVRLQREAAAKELADAKEQRENLIVIAPCDGVMATLEVAEGDEITSGTLLGSILEGEDMNLTIAVDELDVVEVEIGQKVAITIDALSSLEMSGEVYKIAPVGTSSGGVTTYDVELTFDAAGTGVRSGMNATGEITVASTEDTLYVPVEALMTINNETFVMVEDGGSMTLADAASSQSRSSQRGQRGQRAGMQGGIPQGAPDMGGMPDMSGAPDMGGMPDMSGAPDMGGMPDMSGAPDMDGMQDTEDRTQAKEETGDAQTGRNILEKAKAWGISQYEALMVWLYEGVEANTAQQVTGSLVKVTTGMQSDDYAEITSGLSEGDIVLYTASEASSSSFFGGMMGGMPRGF